MSCLWWRRIIGISICLFCIPVPSVYALRSISIQTSTTTLFGDEHIVLSASASGFIDGETIYIKGAFFEIGSSNYFGYSKKNDGTWVKNGETASMQPEAVIGAWDNQLIIKSDFADSGYHGEGEYGLKLGWYYKTSSSTLSSVNWSTNSVSMTLSEPDPTITVTPTPTCVPTHTPIPTVSPTIFLTSTVAPTLRVVATRISSVLPSLQNSSDILGIYKEASKSVSNRNVASEEGVENFSAPHQQSKPMVFALLFLGVGTALLGCGLALEKTTIWNSQQKTKRHQS